MAPRQARRAQARGPGGQWQGSGYWWRSHSKGLHLFITQSPAPSDRDRNYAHHPSPPETTGKGFDAQGLSPPTPSIISPAAPSQPSPTLLHPALQPPHSPPPPFSIQPCSPLTALPHPSPSSPAAPSQPSHTLLHPAHSQQAGTQGGFHTTYQQI
ncbi:proline-rich receptor-like protein kinase PERK2 [Oncorhynchus mykiss]|uniref:proline-rich receptor-like protein kinase PERK2 n=1 Tax=Oncorhynchus mykiss TaxID=8022 RepID=UPI0018786014|nr:proline-rich receptor-like protein kinase PERK2 [Oncorhynchus mykiss]